MAEVSASDRDALLAAIHQPYVDNPVLCNEVGEYVRELQVEAILAAGFSRRRVITDPAEVPVGAVVRRADGLIARRTAHDTAAFFGDTAHDPWSDIYGPVTVLYDPEEER